MARILVTGANGFVGQALCAEALARGFKARGATRYATSSFAEIEYLRVGDIDSGTDWQKALIGVDTLIHLAARVHVMEERAADPLAEFRKVNIDGTRNLAESAARAGVKRLVYVSSVKVSGEDTARPYSELDVPNPQDAYGVSKWEAEQALHKVSAETGLEVVIVRPPLVYGAYVKGNFAQMIKVLENGVPLPFASVKNLRSLIYVENLVDALILCATHPDAAGETYLVSDGEPVSTPDLIRNLAKALSKRCLVFPFPIFIMRFLAKLLGKSAAVDRLTQSLQIDSSKIRRELGWKPPYTMEQALKATAEWYLAQHKK